MILRPDVDVGDGRRAAIPPPRDRFVGRVSREKRHDQYSGLAGGLDESLPRKTARLLALQHGDEGFAGLLVARPASPSARCGEDTRPPLGWKASAQFHTDIALPTLRIQIARQELPSVRQRS